MSPSLRVELSDPETVASGSDLLRMPYKPIGSISTIIFEVLHYLNEAWNIDEKMITRDMSIHTSMFNQFGCPILSMPSNIMTTPICIAKDLNGNAFLMLRGRRTIGCKLSGVHVSILFQPVAEMIKHQAIFISVPIMMSHGRNDLEPSGPHVVIFKSNLMRDLLADVMSIALE